MALNFAWNGALLLSVYAYSDAPSKRDGSAPPPQPEPIEVAELPLPPALANTTEGACTVEVNPRGTGCIATSSLNSGNFASDGLHVAATATFVGAPPAPDPASIYTGVQLLLIKADGTTFPNGDTWKCITCGVPAENRVGAVDDLDQYPQTFSDGTRAMSGSNIIDCGTALLSSEDCTPNRTSIFPIRFSTTADDGSGAGTSIRELRLHPDNVHITFNSFLDTSSGLAEMAYFGRIKFNATASRYDLTNLPPALVVNGDELMFNRSAITVGELRGLTGTGKEVVYVGFPWESCNVDIFAADLATGAVRRITAHPEYADPIAVSPNDEWQVVLDTRGSGRMMFLAGLRSVPPITDLVTVGSVSSVRNNGVRRFFEPYLLDYEGDRGDYFGQKLNAAGDGAAGSINDPNWNTGADPRWSMDGTRVAYYQMLALPPACGGSNPLACETSPYSDLRAERVMVATFTSRKPLPVEPVSEASDEVPWGLKYTPGMEIPAAPKLPGGEFTLRAATSGYANVSIAYDPTDAYIETIAVTYHDYSEDGLSFVSGRENITVTPINATLNRLDWFADIVSTGAMNGTKLTSPDGFHMADDLNGNIFEANGTMVSTVDGVSWSQPCNAC
ncbi:hypothetical protein QBC46DRAFT_461846 [Diplogelasinospora grovesii]|uniref:Saponin hydrolase n=1 Tax=Diplogelasinospora grovesii TaxID=303347 RepID=A0AAN6MYG7_9PEZI|nr:hypothetical protein QBC46DRAFT_461846 [Diplogelasinospora grovesii]